MRLHKQTTFGNLNDTRRTNLLLRQANNNGCQLSETGDVFDSTTSVGSDHPKFDRYTKLMRRDLMLKSVEDILYTTAKGFIKWLGHYSTSHSSVSWLYRDCHSSFSDLSKTNPICEYPTKKEVRQSEHKMKTNPKKASAMLKTMLRHDIKNAFFQKRLLLSDKIHGANQMMPPELLHTSDSGLIMYMLESMHGLIGNGQSCSELDAQHVQMMILIR